MESARSFSRSPLLIIGGLSRKSTGGGNGSYAKLPQEPLKLSVLKLDGSCFGIEVRKAASVAELKEAVEAAFVEFRNEGFGQISWPHVWEQFCLCFDGRKLVAEIDCIRDFGIKDGDQLYFIRHHSPTYRMVKIRSRKRVFLSKQHKRSSPRRPSNRGKDENEKEDDDDYDNIDSTEHQHTDIKNGEFSRLRRESKLKHFFKRWFWRSRRRAVTGRRSTVFAKPKGEAKVRPTTFSFSFWRIFGKRPHSG